MARKTTSPKKVKPRRNVPVKTKSTVVELAPAPSARQKKSTFRAGTLIAILLLLGLIELTVYLKQQKEKTSTGTATAVSEAAPIFNAEDGVITSIEIKPTEGETVKVARDAKNAWVVELPIKAEADQGLVEAAATQVSALRVINLVDGDPEIFGLKDPAFIITVEFKRGTPPQAGGAGEKHTLEVGSATPTNSGYYVRVDKDKMMITDLSGIQSLLQLVVSPPYLNTPTPPTVSATLTPVPATELPQAGSPTP
jgi:hypothetical protein